MVTTHLLAFGFFGTGASTLTPSTGAYAPGVPPLSFRAGFSPVEAAPEPEVVARARGGWLPPRRKQKPDWEQRDREEREFVAYLEGLYAQIRGEQPAEAVQVVREYTRGRAPKKQPPRPKRVDFVALSRNAEAVEALLRAAEQAREDEDSAVLLLL